MGSGTKKVENHCSGSLRRNCMLCSIWSFPFGL